MKSKRNLRNTSFYVLSGAFLILAGAILYTQRSSITLVSPGTPRAQISYAKVTRVIDGDTIVIDTGQTVRYIGINTPEVETSECFATEAGEINEDMILGKEVRLEKDISETDKYGRLLRYVYTDEGPDGYEMINDELLKIGLAKVETVPPDIKYKDEFDQSQDYAKQNKLGLWSKCF